MKNNKTGRPMVVGLALAFLLNPDARQSLAATPSASRDPHTLLVSSSLADSPRARRLLQLARAYLPQDWRYPSTTARPDLGLALEMRRLLPVELRQQPNGYTCGSASLGILLSRHQGSLSENLLQGATRMSPEGVDPRALVEAAGRLGYEATEKYEATVDDILGQLSVGVPVLIDYQASYGPQDAVDPDSGHYSVVVAADAREFLLVDPSEVNALQLRRIPRHQLGTVWWDTYIGNERRFDRWMMTVRPRRRR